MDEARKNDLILEQLKDNVAEEENVVDQYEIFLEREKMQVSAHDFTLGEFCKDNAFRELDAAALKKYEQLKSSLSGAKKRIKRAKTNFEQAKTRLYLAKKELQDFLESINS